MSEDQNTHVGRLSLSSYLYSSNNRKSQTNCTLLSTNVIRDPVPELWHPENGTREDFMRCKGFPCEKWDATISKLIQLKMEVAKENGVDLTDLDFDIMETDESLDNCIWLTEEQIDSLMAEMDSEETNGRTKRKAEDFRERPYKKWDLPIRWKFDGTHDSWEKTQIRNAYQHIMDNTCIRFIELDTQEKYRGNHLLMTSEKSGCHSFVGKVFLSPQTINLQSVCIYEFGINVHEILHALGLWHEQSRPDRDDHIKVNWANIGSYAGQFTIRHSTYDYGVDYSHASVMHYGSKAGTNDWKKFTMESVDPLYQGNMGQRTGMSYADAKILNRMYCEDTCKDVTIPSGCGEGYQDPNNCHQCKCPPGFSGRGCMSVAPSSNPDCGGVMYVTGSDPVVIESPGYSSGSYEDHTECNWLIQTSSDKQIQMQFVDDFGLYCQANVECYHWVEVKYKQNIFKEGPRFCCYSRPEAVLTSEAHQMLVHFASNHTQYSRRRGFRAEIRAVDAIGNPSDTTTTLAPPTVNTEQPPWSWVCDFEQKQGLCDMMQSSNDDFNWIINSGNTKSEPTGPQRASKGEFYAYIETSNPRKEGDRAELLLPSVTNSGDYCLNFDYHMYGFHINTLMIQRYSNSGARVIWAKSKDQGNKWHSAEINVNMEAGKKLSFVGVRGMEYSGDIAIDNIKLTSGKC